MEFKKEASIPSAIVSIGSGVQTPLASSIELTGYRK
jgi:hypothetical protein